MYHIVSEYEGQLRTRLKHVQSGNEILTDAPRDNHGKGEAFSPTDLVAGALGSCILTIMAIVGERRNIDLKGTRAEITKVMGKNPRRISEIYVQIYFQQTFPSSERKILEKAAHTCPVHKSLDDALEKKLIFNYPVEK